MTRLLDRLTKGCFGLSLAIARSNEEELTLQPVQFCFPEPLSSLSDKGQSLLEHLRAFLGLLFAHICVRDKSQPVRRLELSAGVSPGRESSAHLRYAFWPLALVGYGPAAAKYAHRQPE